MAASISSTTYPACLISPKNRLILYLQMAWGRGFFNRSRDRRRSDGRHRFAQHASGERSDDALKMSPGFRTELLLPFLVEASFAQLRTEAVRIALIKGQ